MLLTNEEVQTVLAQAIEILAEASVEDNPDASRINFVKSFLEFTKAYSASGNTIPGFGGVGIKETYRLAESIVEKGSITLDRDFEIFNIKPIAENIKLTTRTARK